MSGCHRLPDLCIPEPQAVSAATPVSGRDLPAPQVPELYPDFPDGSGGDRWRLGAEVPGLDRAAGDFFRADAERTGYIAPNADPGDARAGLSRYYRDHGLLSDRAYRRISQHEISSLDMERIEVEIDCE